MYYFDSYEHFFENGMHIEMIPIINPNDYSWIDLMSLFDDYHTDASISWSSFLDMDADSLASENSNSFTFETLISGTAFYVGLADYNYTNSYKISFDKSTAILNGMHMRGEFHGTMENTSLELYYEQQIERTGFDLEPFRLGKYAETSDAPGFPFVLTFATLAMIPVLVTVFGRRK